MKKSSTVRCLFGSQAGRRGVTADDISFSDEFMDVSDGKTKDDVSLFKQSSPPQALKPSRLSNRRPLADITNRMFEVSPLSSRNLRSSSTPYLRGYSRKRLTIPEDNEYNKTIPEDTAPEQLELRRSPRFDMSSLAVSSHSKEGGLHPLQDHHSPSTSLHRSKTSPALFLSPRILEVEYSLKTLDKVDSQAFRRISGETLSDLLRSLGNEQFNKKYVIIDCRYPYEYNGGHIVNAINLHDSSTTMVSSTYFGDNSILRDEDTGEKKIAIFHCEFSEKRGPAMANALRATDRNLHYLTVHHEEIYVLEGGYKTFFAYFGNDLCTPCAYVRMKDKAHATELKNYKAHKKSRPVASGIRSMNYCTAPSTCISNPSLS